MSQQAAYSAQDLLWELRKDVEVIKTTMVTQDMLTALLNTKQDKGVSEERWRQVHEDVTALQQQPQQNRQNLFAGWNTGINGCMLIILAVSALVGMLGGLAGVAGVIVSLLKP